MLLAGGVVVGLIAAALVGARWDGLAHVRWRLAPLCLAGLLIQVVLFSRSAALVEPLLPWAPGIHLVSVLMVLTSLVANWRLPGLPLLVLGAALNFAAIAANGGQMPTVATPAPGPFTNVARMDESSGLALLGDWLWLPYVPRPFSIGDVLIGIGGGYAAYRFARGTRPPVVVLGRR